MNTLEVGEVIVILRDWEMRRLKQGDNELHLGHIKMKETVVKLAAKDIHYMLFTCSPAVCVCTLKCERNATGLRTIFTAV